MSPRPFHTVKKINDSESHSELIQRDLEVKKSETGNINNDRKSWIEQSGGLIWKNTWANAHFVVPYTPAFSLSKEISL